MTQLARQQVDMYHAMQGRRHLSRSLWQQVRKEGQCTHETSCPARATLGKHENTAQEGVSASNTRGMGSAQAVYAIPRSLLHHLFCELKLEERMSEESAAAVMDIIVALTAQTDELPMQLQDTGVSNPQGAK